MSGPTTKDVTVDVTVLGASDAFCSGGEPYAAFLVRTGGSTFLLDCGPTVVLSLKRAGVDLNAIDFVVVSHMHGDHFGGVPFLILDYMWESRRTRPFLVVGPAGIEERVWALFRALYRDIDPADMAFELRFQELHPEKQLTIQDVDVHPFWVPHQVEDTALAVRLEANGKKILYTGDSPWFDRFVELARDVDLFLCECTAYDSSMGRHIEWTTLKPILPRIAARRLVLVHLGREMRAHAAELGVEVAVEGMTISV
jgi:ribonuclease BN (tRNA processing enzyme)